MNRRARHCHDRLGWWRIPWRVSQCEWIWAHRDPWGLYLPGQTLEEEKEKDEKGLCWCCSRAVEDCEEEKERENCWRCLLLVVQCVCVLCIGVRVSCSTLLYCVSFTPVHCYHVADFIYLDSLDMFLYNCILPLCCWSHFPCLLRGPFPLACLLSSIEVLTSLGFLLARWFVYILWDHLCY